jgi:TonB family protein
MRKLFGVAVLIALAASYCGGQSSAPAAKDATQKERVKVYAAGAGVSAPELLPLNSPPLDAAKCKKKANGMVMLSVIVDAEGRPRNLMFYHPVGNDLDRFALQIAAADRFKPGVSEGAAVAVAQLLEVNMQGCIDEVKGEKGKKSYSYRLEFAPEQRLLPLPQPPLDAVLTPSEKSQPGYENGVLEAEKIGGRVIAPEVIYGPEAEFSNQARKKKYEGVCAISLVVDRNGMPQNLEIAKGLDYGLSDNALATVSHYRFSPAMRDGVEPVAVKLTVEVNFRLY